MTGQRFDLSGLSVCISIPSHRDIPVETVASLLETQAHLIRRGIPLEMYINSGSSLVVAARSKAVWQFLQSDCNRMFWIDSDIVWEPSEFFRLLALSTKMDVVFGAYPQKRDPLLFPISLSGETVETNEYGCLPNVGTGLGFCCMQRHVLEKLSDKSQKLFFPDVGVAIPHIFRTDSVNGNFRGEDIAMFDDIQAMGIDVFLDPNITLGHHGSKTFTGKLADQLKEFEYHGTS